MAIMTRCLSLFILLAVARCQLDPSRFRVVDAVNGNYMVRGNLPIINDTFAFDRLHAELSKFTNTSGYRLVVVSLLNFVTAKQTRNRYIEEGFFDHDGKREIGGVRHEYANFGILGSYWSPGELPEWARSLWLQLYDYTTFDQTPALVQFLRKKIKSPEKTIVYVHCSQGVDRAGYVSAAYKMKFKSAVMEDVIKQNLRIMASVRKHIHFNSFNGLQWYCLYLGRSEEECLLQKRRANHASEYEL